MHRRDRIAAQTAEFCADSPHVAVERALGHVQIIGVRALQELRATEHDPGALDQRGQDLEFGGRELHALAREGRLVAFDIELELAVAERARLDALCWVQSQSTSKRRSTARTRATSSRGENGLTK